MNRINMVGPVVTTLILVGYRPVNTPNEGECLSGPSKSITLSNGGIKLNFEKSS